MRTGIEVRAESLEPQTDQVGMPVVACMGVAACRRVCEFISPTRTLEAADPKYALPFEQDCSVLNDIANQPNEVATELLSTVTLPELDSLAGNDLVQEAVSFMTHLETEQAAFDTYIQTLLRGTNQPRFALKNAKQTYLETQRYSSEYTPATEEDKEVLLAFHAILRGFYDRHSLEQTGLLFDSGMEQMFVKAAQEIGVGHHIKLVGEPGIAKTTFAKYLALQNAIAHNLGIDKAALQPTVISFSSTSEAEAQMSEQTFQDGTLGKQLGEIGQAMKQGRGVVLDEQNGMTADQQTYFNDLFLKKPGQAVTIKGETFEITKGFCVIATLNSMTDTQGNRRHGRQQQDSANAARFSRLDFTYPYQQGYLGNASETISRVFFAHYVDSFGWQMPSTATINLLTDINEFMRDLTKKATAPTIDGTTTSITAAQARPDLTECISPRDLVRELEVGLHYGFTPDEAAVDLRQRIYNKVQQILNSDNGHFVTQKTKDAVNTLLRNGKFNA